MARYRFELSDYHAIQEANISLDGITVLSGLNGTGKSTIAKCLQGAVGSLLQEDWPTEEDDGAVHVQLLEDGVGLLDEKGLKLPLMLNRVIYINTLEMGNLFNRKYMEGTEGQLLKMLSDSSGPNVNEMSRDVALLIKNLIGGDISIDKKKGIGMCEQPEFRYVAKNGKSFNLKGAGSGIISFSYILLLLQNGWLTDKTILIVDEPESHLHPQWIVDYARILVLINKKLGTKILLSSHHPDMIAAIQTISESKGLKDVTRFYLAQPSTDEPDRRIYKDLGFNIEEIFDSFNIAIERINSFGSIS